MSNRINKLKKLNQINNETREVLHSKNTLIKVLEQNLIDLRQEIIIFKLMQTYAQQMGYKHDPQNKHKFTASTEAEKVLIELMKSGQDPEIIYKKFEDEMLSRLMSGDRLKERFPELAPEVTRDLQNKLRTEELD